MFEGTMTYVPTIRSQDSKIISYLYTKDLGIHPPLIIIECVLLGKQHHNDIPCIMS